MLNNNNDTKILKLNEMKERLIKEISKCDNNEKLDLLNNKYIDLITYMYLKFNN